MMFTHPELICPDGTHRNMSFSPEKRDAQETVGAASVMRDIINVAEALNARDDTAKITQADLDKTFAYYIKIQRARWASLSRCASAMITGPANFPQRQMERRREAEHKRLGELVKFYESYEDRLRAIAFPRVSKTAVPLELATVTERTEHGIRIIENQEADRLQLIFEGKPEPESIALLKSRGFKWSPRFGAWQRQLTDNARSALKYHVMPKLAEYEA